MAETKVLVVDDDAAVRGVVGAALARAGITVTVAADGADALRALADGRVDLVVLDWNMPGMSGLEVLEILGRDRPGLPVMVCTGAGTADRNVALSLGAIDFFTKDRPVAEFVRRVEAILSGDFDPLEPDDRDVPADGGGSAALRTEAAAIAHELHNHLTVILGHTDLVRTEVERSGGALRRPDQVLADLDAVAGATERIAALSQRLRELTGPGGGRARPGSGSDDPAPAVGARILLVEDDLDLRVTAERLLRDEGYDVLTAADVTTALELLHDAGPVDLCITDLVLPGAGPGDAAARLADAAPGTPLLIMSGYGSDVVEASAAPPTAGFLAKPFTRDRLLDGIRGALAT